MVQRRRFLRYAYWLGSAGLYGGFMAGCAMDARRPAVENAPVGEVPPAAVANPPASDNVAVPAPTPPHAKVPSPPPSPGPVPPPDLFDASLLDRDFWVKPRTISLVRPANGEQISLLYWKNGAMLPGVYDRLCLILRDVQAKTVAPIDPKLIETLWACQAFCARYGLTHPIDILSGYRTAQTNRKLVEAGLPAARKSLHMDGKAADIRIWGLNPEVLGDLVKSFERGGVGFYYRANAAGGWIHTDTGVNRVWHG